MTEIHAKLAAQTDEVRDSNSLRAHFSSRMSGSEQTLRDSIEIALNEYFSNLDGQMVSNVYDLVLSEVEQPLLQAVLRYTSNNQTKASSVLGMNRGTLRKKLKQYELL